MSMLKAFLATALLLVSSIASAAVDINTADAGSLATINGIGTSKAQAIVKYRDDVGAFKSVDDLVNVKGIGPKLLERIRAEVSVGKPAK